MFNRLRILSIRHHLLWEFFVYWTSSWGIVIGSLYLTAIAGFFNPDMSLSFEILYTVVVIFPSMYWLIRCKIKAYNLLFKYVDTLGFPKRKAQV
jgi:hypothetical protein